MKEELSYTEVGTLALDGLPLTLLPRTPPSCVGFPRT